MSKWEYLVISKASRVCGQGGSSRAKLGEHGEEWNQSFWALSNLNKVYACCTYDHNDVCLDERGLESILAVDVASEQP